MCLENRWYEFEGAVPECISGYDKSIYHLLCGSFGQCVSISEVIDLDVFDVITVRNIHVPIYVTCARAGYTGRCRFDRRTCDLKAKN